MRKLIGIICGLFIFLFLNQTPLYALSIAEDYYPPQSGISQGQNHYYSVFFRGNGEAVVNFRTQFTNNQDNSLSTLTYFVPNKSDVNNLSVYQRVNEYMYPCYPPIYDQPEFRELDEETDSKIPSISVLPTPTPLTADQIYPESTIAPCLDQPMYYRGGSNYLKADFQLNGNVLRITLPREVSISESVNLIITYRSLDYAKENFPGSFNYKFDTLRSNDEIDNIQIGISVEQDYVLKGAKGQVKYRHAVSELSPPSTSGSTDLYNKEFDVYYNLIGQGEIYKYTSHLAPMESYTVSGMYADSFWKLYLRQILFVLLIVIVIALVIMIVFQKIMKIANQKNDKKEAIKNSFWMRLSSDQRSLLIASFVSMLGATLAVIYTLFLFFFVARLESYVSYANGLGAIFLLLVVVFSFVVYAGLLFLPAIIISVKQTITWGVATFILTIFWLLVYLVIVIFLGSVLFSDNPRIMEYPSNVGAGSSSYIE